MSDNSLKNSKNSEKDESENPEGNEDEENEEEDVKINNENIYENIDLNTDEQNYNEGKKYIIKKKNNIKYEDKQVQNGKVISINNENINQQNEELINDIKDNRIKEYEKKK